WAEGRPTVAKAPPGGNGTTRRIGRVGQCCALAVSDSAERAQTPAARCRKRRRGSFILLSLTKAASRNRHLHLLHDVRGRTVAFAPSPRRGEGCSAFSTPRNGGGGSGPSAPPVTPSPHPSSPKR